MSLRNRNRFRLMGWIGGLLLVLMAGWLVGGPRWLFRIQVWLLTQGSWNNVEHWIDHGDRYLPYLIEEADNLSPAPTTVILTARSPDAFEAYVHYHVDTVSDCVRLVLKDITGTDDGVACSSEDGTTNWDRIQAGKFWQRWYNQNRDKVVWDARRTIFVIKRR